MPDQETGSASMAMPKVLTGPSAATLVLRGLRYELGALLIGSLAMLESYLPGPWYIWGAAILVIVITLLSIGLTNTLRGYRKLNEEKRRGYTTAIGDAIKDPSLYLLDRKALRVVAAPYEPRDRKRS